jgi:hypothetical protein
MRYLAGLVFVLALGVMGCSGTTGLMLCEDVTCEDDGNECTGDGVCDPADGTCDYPPVEDGTVCDESNECAVGQCASGACELTPVTNGTACGDDAGTCQDGSCEVACTEQGIRDAIAAGGGPYTFGCADGTTVVTDAEIVIDNDVILDGEGNLTVHGNEEHRVFSVPHGVTAEMNGFIITRGLSLDGVGIDNRGTLTIANSTVSECEGDLGGAVANSGTLTMTNCTVSGNRSDFAAGIFNNEELTMTNCTVSGNTSAGNGGGVTNADGRLTMTNCTVSGNKAGSEGGGILNAGDGTLTITNSTVSGNTAGGKGGGIMSGNAGGLSVANSLIEGDCVTEDDATVVSNGYNIESPGDTCGFDPDGTDQVSVTAEELSLGELAANGGPTDTHALLPGSIAIDVIPEAMCEVDTDQRGVTRPQGAACDVGAFELEVTP